MDMLKHTKKNIKYMKNRNSLLILIKFCGIIGGNVEGSFTLD